MAAIIFLLIGKLGGEAGAAEEYPSIDFTPTETRAEFTSRSRRPEFTLQSQRPEFTARK